MPDQRTSNYDLPIAQAVLDAFTLQMYIYRTSGLLVAMNRHAEQTMRVQRDKVVGSYNVLHDPQMKGVAEFFRHAVQGKVVELPPFFYSTARTRQEQENKVGFWATPILTPICDQAGTVTHVIVLSVDVTEQMHQMQVIEQARAEIEQARAEITHQRMEIEQARAEIDHQRKTIHDLSTPVVQVWEGILTVPLVGTIDAQRALVIMEHVLEAIVAHQAESVILDITGVPIVDSEVASYLLSTARACRLLGSRVALVGVRSEIAQAIVRLGLDMGEVVTLADLQAGLAWAFAQHGLEVQQRGTQKGNGDKDSGCCGGC